MGTLRIEVPARKRALQEGNNQITLCTGLETHTTKGWKKFCCCQCNKDFQYVWAWCVNLSKDSVLGSKPHEHQKSSKRSLRSKSPSLFEVTLDSWAWLKLLQQTTVLMISWWSSSTELWTFYFWFHLYKPVCTHVAFTADCPKHHLVLSTLIFTEITWIREYKGSQCLQCHTWRLWSGSGSSPRLPACIHMPTEPSLLFLPASPLQPCHLSHLPRVATHAQSNESPGRERLF